MLYLVIQRAEIVIKEMAMKLKLLLWVIPVNLWLLSTVQGGDLNQPGQSDFSQFSSPYLGLTPPESKAEIFLPNLVSTNLEERCVTFLDSGRVLVFTTDDGGTHFTWLDNGHWIPAQPFPFNYQDDMLDYTAGPDDKTLIFMTSRPVDEDDVSGTHHLWSVEWSGSTWGNPVPLSAPRKIDGLGSGYPTLTGDGSLFFISDARDGAAEGGIFVSHISDGSNGRAELVPPPVNSEHIDFDPYVAPDGRYLVFTSNRPGGMGKYDNYIVFREKDGSWSPAFNLGEKFNSEHSECCPNVTADGKLFFFVSRKPSDFLKDNTGRTLPTGRDVYWAGAGWIETMEKWYQDYSESPSSETTDYADLQIEIIHPTPFPIPVNTDQPAHYVRTVTFSPAGTEAFWPVIDRNDGYRRWIETSSLTGRTWSSPTTASFSKKGFEDDVPHIAPDGNLLIFNSRRPLKQGEQIGKENVWYVSRLETGWSEPKPIPGTVNSSCEIHQLISVDSNQDLYFGGACGDEYGELDIYRAAFSNGQYQGPVNLGPVINTPAAEYGAFVPADGSYLLFTRNLLKGWTLMISLRNADQWTPPIDLRDLMDGFENMNLSGGSITHDGERLIFFENGSPHRVSTSFIDVLKAKILQEK